MEKNSSLLLSVFKTAIGLLPHSKSRVPYTYHHDYIRQNIREYGDMSRSEIAEITKHHTDEELYAIAFLHILRNETKPEFLIEFFKPQDTALCKGALEQAVDIEQQIKHNLLAKSEQEIDDEDRQPKNLEDAINILIKHNQADLDKVRQMSDEESFAHGKHLSIGMALRNHWHLWWSKHHGHENWPKEKPEILEWFHKNTLIRHPDDISAAIMRSFYQRVNNLPVTLYTKEFIGN